MKTSSGLLLGVLFTLVVVIVALVIYFNTRPEEIKPVTSTGPSPTLPTIGDLTIAQTLSPDSDSEPYTIEPYTIEYEDGNDEATVYVEGDNEKSLSKNVTFTLNWKNQGNFDTVSKIEVEHYIREKGTDTPLQTIEVDSSQQIETNGITSWNYAPISVKISGLPDDNSAQYSFIGENMFKVVATYDGAKKLPLYDGTEALGEGESHPPELVIKPEDLTATIDMTVSERVIYNVSLLGDTRATTTNIVNKTYTFTATALNDETTNKPTNISKLENMEIISQDDKGKEFIFKYPDGKYIGIERRAGTQDASTGEWRESKILLKKVAVEDAVKITFMNSGKDKSADGGDTYRMLRINVEKCMIGANLPQDQMCGQSNADKTAVSLYLYGSEYSSTSFPFSFKAIEGRTQQEMAMRHWKLT